MRGVGGGGGGLVLGLGFRACAYLGFRLLGFRLRDHALPTKLRLEQRVDDC